ncbi:MAG: MBOAT family protein [Butyrivibrio sp.]|nr:MBOAT family protein [Butyrivibrio sp.]
MEITSFFFLCFLAIVLILYYLIPGKLQWVVLLAASVAFYLLSGNGVLIIYPIIAIFVTWISMHLLSKTDKSALVKRRLVLSLEVVVLLGILAGLKYNNFISTDSIIAPLGLSFYTFILLGYFLDVYNNIAEPEESFFKTALMGMYFPVMISGPILRMRDLKKDFFSPHKLDYNNITFGVQRMLWGFFKELVISERLGVIAGTVFNNDTEYPGAYIWVGALCFTFQLYANFSGCMDIVIGISEMFGLKLPENFDVPFMTKSISEYWRKWHITLGEWMKEHVFYPLLRTQMIMKLGKKLRDKFGKKKGKQLTTYVAMFILWFSVGMWHGGALKYVIGSGLLHWFYIVFGEVTLPFWTKLFTRFHIDMKSRVADGVRIVRTFFLVNIGNVFFRADSVPHACRMLKEAVTTWNPQVLVNGSLFELGLDWIDCSVALISIAILIIVSLYQLHLEKEAENKGESYDYHGVRRFIASKNIILRWIILFAALFYVILLGQYGPGYSAAEFIYQNF